ncbi:PKD domain-containing protein [Pontibacter sp. H249]|uniref:PKD domain-containing protein n=1 Tax=Pontibacter sp. H249 TaxID=3133420 RepID=UPI0030C23483
MKRYLSYIVALLLLTFTFSSCEEEEGSLGPAPTSEAIQFTAQADATNPNIISFKANAPGFKAVWDLGNGETATGMQVTGAYPLKGEYTVTLTMYTSGGSASSSKQVTIAKTNALMLDREDYNFLTGGANALEGKTWVFDPVGPMNFGGPPEAPSSWWNQTLDGQNDCMKDDKYTFKLIGFEFENKSGGAMWGIDGGQENVCVPQTPVASTWSIYQENGKTMLSVSNGETIAWDDNEGTYEVIELSENRLHIRKVCCGGDGVRNYVLVPEGYKAPVKVKPYKEAIDLKDDFDTPGNVVWQTDNLTFNETYDNPAPLTGNTSAKVGQYIKQAGEPFAFANLFYTLDHKIDLTTKNKIKLKVFMPGYNDYTTEAGYDWAVKNLLKQVSVKLQNAESGEPWVTQVEVKQQVTQLDKWVELTFDFSSAASRKDLDRIVIQIGGEGHFNSGIFYIDDFKLIP